MHLRQHTGGVQGEASDAHQADERGASGSPGPDAGVRPGEAHKHAGKDLDVHETPPLRDELQRHRQRRQSDPAHGGEVV